MFSELAQHVSVAHPQMILGIGSIVGVPTAALYLAHGANFVVGHAVNPVLGFPSLRCTASKLIYFLISLQQVAIYGIIIT
jgi:2-keto-3-deoxy-6-phosphogluconate aldolase